MPIPCKCPGQLKKRLFKAAVGRGKTADDAAADLNVKVAKAQQDFQNEFDKWIRSVRCLGGCQKSHVSGTKTGQPTTPTNLGNVFVTVEAVAGLAIVSCKEKILVKNLTPGKNTPKRKKH